MKRNLFEEHEIYFWAPLKEKQNLVHAIDLVYNVHYVCLC